MMCASIYIYENSSLTHSLANERSLVLMITVKLPASGDVNSTMGVDWQDRAVLKQISYGSLPPIQSCFLKAVANTTLPPTDWLAYRE